MDGDFRATCLEIEGEAGDVVQPGPLRRLLRQNEPPEVTSISTVSQDAHLHHDALFL